jgi:hypothetical protein
MAPAPDQPNADGASFVREIVSDPKNVPDVILLYGYLGASSEEGHNRLYLSPDLANYVEIPKEAVLQKIAGIQPGWPEGARKLPLRPSKLCLSFLWIIRTTGFALLLRGQHRAIRHGDQCGQVVGLFMEPSILRPYLFEFADMRSRHRNFSRPMV